jgi:uncharacterized protein HemX
MKKLLLRLYAVLIVPKAELHREATRLKDDNEHLRNKLAALQKSKMLAEAQADELRKDKERLRVKIADQKRTADQENRVTEQLRTKYENLQESYDQLRTKTNFLQK